jgi:hypothetical protein
MAEKKSSCFSALIFSVSKNTLVFILSSSLASRINPKSVSLKTRLIPIFLSDDFPARVFKNS